MDRMPLELICQICSYLPVTDIKSAFNVSTKFRSAAEDYADINSQFAFWELTPANERVFLATYTGFGLRLLRDVQFEPRLPDLQGDDCTCRESQDELTEKDEAFTEQMQFLFRTLKTLEDRAGTRNLGKYQLTILTPVQEILGEPCLHRESVHWRTHLLDHHTLPQLRSVTSLEMREPGRIKLDYRITFDLATRLPNSEMIYSRNGSYEWNPYRPEAPARYYKYEYDGPRRDTRHDMGKAIISARLPASLHTCELDFFPRDVMPDAEGIHHMKAQPNLIGSAPMDPYSNSLRILSYPLRRMTLRVQADESLFWPQDGSTPTWPNLQQLFVMFHMVSPSGSWYFAGPMGEGKDLLGYDIDQRRPYPPFPPPRGVDEDEWDGDDGIDTDWAEELDPEDESGNKPSTSYRDDSKDPDCRDNEGHRSFEIGYNCQFRLSPNDDILRPFLSSFAKAAANMPELKEAVLWCPLRWDCPSSVDDNEWAGANFDYFEPPKPHKGSINHPQYLAWALAYFAPGQNSKFPGEFGKVPEICQKRQIFWKVGTWRPDIAMHGLFQRIGREEHGEALLEHWNDEEYGQGLVSRHFLNEYTPEED
ncbi:hypothetical protein NX059_006516 [Plenodomus lindquistii]|nr:hypothetical protein NX059_006516 [Plenodomus lindquistii]